MTLSKVNRSDPGEQSDIAVKPIKKRKVSEDRMKLFVLPHPLIRHWIAALRTEKTKSGERFKNVMAELGRLLFYEASKDCLITASGNFSSPMGAASGQVIHPKKPIAIVPILRAGLALAEHAASGLTSKQTYHLGISRDIKTLRATVYLNTLPERFPEGSRVFLVDPMLATGVTVDAALELIKKCGVDNESIRVISAIVAHDAYDRLLWKYPGLEVYAGAFDEKVNEDGFILPGLGDAGDRCFATSIGQTMKLA